MKSRIKLYTHLFIWKMFKCFNPTRISILTSCWVGPKEPNPNLITWHVSILELELTNSQKDEQIRRLKLNHLHFPSKKPSLIINQSSSSCLTPRAPKTPLSKNPNPIKKNSSHESNPKPSNLRSKAKQKKIEHSTCHASSVRWKSCSYRSACIRTVSSGWWDSAFRASFTVFCSSIFWTHKINQNQTSSYSIS